MLEHFALSHFYLHIVDQTTYRCVFLFCPLDRKYTSIVIHQSGVWQTKEDFSMYICLSISSVMQSRRCCCCDTLPSLMLLPFHIRHRLYYDRSDEREKRASERVSERERRGKQDYLSCRSTSSWLVKTGIRIPCLLADVRPLVIIFYCSSFWSLRNDDFSRSIARERERERGRQQFVCRTSSTSGSRPPLWRWMQNEIASDRRRDPVRFVRSHGSDLLDNETLNLMKYPKR